MIKKESSKKNSRKKSGKNVDKKTQKKSFKNFAGKRFVKKSVKKERNHVKSYSGNFLIDNFRESLCFIKNSKKYIYSIIILFFVFALIGFFVPPTPEIENEIMTLFEGLVAKTQGMSMFELVFFIMFNNIQSSFFGLFFGIVLGVFPVFSAIMNGYVLGFASNLSVGNAGLGSLLQLLPHGVFELPALFIALGLGLRLGSFVFNQEKRSFKKEIIDSLKVFIFVIIPLLFIAGIIEGSLIYLLR